MRLKSLTDCAAALAACLVATAAAAVPPPPPGDQVVTRTAVGALFHPNQCGACPVGGISTFVGTLNGAWGGSSQGGGTIIAGPTGYAVDTHIDAGGAINLWFGAGGHVQDYIYVNAPAFATGDYVPMTVTRWLGGSWTASLLGGTGGGPVPGGYLTVGVELETGLIGEVGYNSLPSSSVASLALASVTHSGLYNRRWNYVGTWLNSAIVTSLGNPDALQAWGGVQIVPTNAGVGTTLVSLSGRDYTSLPLPEPDAWMLLLAGGLVVAWRRRVETVRA